MARLSLERIYADENGQPIPRLLDVYPDGTEEYEPQEDPVTKLGQTLFRIFQERRDVFDIDAPKRQDAKDEEESDDDKEEQPEKATQKMSMTPEDLMKMRNELMPQLHIAMGEMSLARDLLALLLSNSPPTAQAPALAVSTVSKPPPIPSVAAFNTLLTTGGKDESLRSASDVLGTAAREIERVNESNEKYWQNALLVRSSGWGLVPAPLPPGTSGGNKFARDFLISYGLEQASPPFKRRALAQLSTNSPSPLTFPAREGLRLRVTYETANGSSSSMVGRSKSSDNLDEILRDAQSEVVESEIFRRLIEEAGSLPTAGARVSEKLIVVEAAQGVDLKFELVDEVEEDEASQPESIEACLIGSVLRLYLLQMHRSPRRSSRLLQPIIDVVQYVRFCERVEDEVTMMASSLRDAGFKVRVRFQRVGEGGEGIVGGERMGGEAVLRVDGRHTVRLTMEAPCRLVAHLGRATLGLSSMSQLSQLLREEMEDYLLRKICEAGPEAGGWVVDRMTGSVVGNVGGENRQVSVRFGTRYGIECRVGSRAFSGGRLIDWVRAIM
ncbi:hypothetical protein SISSUDRAFT_1130093 [Sistotremastrum suecicum HHB10207 ss-3]|uniref:Mediator of RNA polymerase II transcription subunit 17 n=1 Tax=Sistotremastrum suecicum HHB10207 ss-3 TaxID=1314776 RepID=A0A166BWX8_9AGAM|nr:hypothetical protein SISSUDRAFT_1130093 [Sistotremastrum suecicum HHB10207 ss-3]